VHGGQFALRAAAQAVVDLDAGDRFAQIAACQVVASALVGAASSCEREVARLMCMGFTAARAACILGVSTATVRSHIKSIYRKLGLGNQTGLVRRLLHASPA